VSTIRVGIVGAGWIAQEHRRVLHAAGEHDPAAVACTPSDAAATLAVAAAAGEALRTSRAIRVGTF
jgi:predicted dehydrogenase